MKSCRPSPRHPDAGARGISFLEPDEVRGVQSGRRGVTSKGRCTARVTRWSSPGSALGALRAHLDAWSGARPLPLPPGSPRRRDRSRAPSIDSRGTRWEGDLVVVATGAAYDHLPGTDALGRHGCGGYACRCSRRRRSPRGSRRRWPTPTRCATTRPTRRHRSPCLRSRAPWPPTHHLQLLLVQRPDGGLTIGDTHAYGEPFDFALCEDPTEELLCPGQDGSSARSSHRYGAAGRVCTPSAPTAECACARRSGRGSGSSPGRAGAA